VKTLLLVLALLCVGTAASAQEAYIELLRSDVRTEKVAIITEAMDFTDEEASAFWPVYRKYEYDLAKLKDLRIELIKEYLKHYDSMTNRRAKDLMKRSFKLEEKQTTLRKNHFSKFERVLGSMRAAKLMQIERQLEMLIDLQIAAEIPILE
jgi:hypothetical protein